MSNWQTVRMLAKHWLWIVAATALCAVLLWSSARMDRQVSYRAAAAFLLLPAQQGPATDQVLSASQKAALFLLNTPEFRQSMALTLALPKEQIPSITMDGDAGAMAIRVSVVAEDAQKASDIANGAMDSAMVAIKDVGLPVNPQILSRAANAQPIEPVDGGRTRGALGAALGLALSLCALLLRYYLSDTIKNEREVRELLGREVLAELPRVRDNQSVPVHRSERLRRAVEGLAVHLRYGKAGEGGVIGVTSARRDEGKSVVSALLAEALCTGGRTALLVDMDWTNPSVHKHYKLGAGAGTADVLCGRSALQTAAQPVLAAPGLSVLAAGSGPCDSADAMHSLIRQAAEAYDFVVVDLTAVGSRAAVTATARLLDRVVFVAMAESTTLQNAQRSLKLLDAAGVAVRGVALTDA